MTRPCEPLVPRPRVAWWVGAALACCVAGCGGGGGSAPGFYAVGGMLSGLPAGASVTLQDNASDTLTLSADGAFSFQTTLAGASRYAVTVLRHTVGVSCSVAQGSGSVGQGTATGVAVQCGPGTETLLHSFGATGSGDGINPRGLAIDGAGDLFGTTVFGGANDAGVVYEIPKTAGGYGAEAVLASFAASGVNATGSNPVGDLLVDSAGDLFGTTSSGGANDTGVVYEIPKTAGGYGTEAVLASFAASGVNATGAGPGGDLAIDSAGDLFGTTYAGGANNTGVVYEIPKTAGGYGTEVVLASFAAAGANATGAQADAGVSLDSAGNLYGTTYSGGANDTGVVYEIPKTAGGYGTEVVLASFGVTGANATGGYPLSGVTLDAAGNLYGATDFGGANDTGVVYEIPKTAGGYGTEVVLASFAAGGVNTVGSYAANPVLVDSAGNLYGTTSSGGANNTGVVYEFPRSVSGFGPEVLLASFAALGANSAGSYPRAALQLDSAGSLYGSTYEGGANNTGAVFEID